MIPVHQSGKRILGRVFYNEEIPEQSGWILQYFDSGQLCSVFLGIEVREAVLAAVADAADYLSCRPEHIQVGQAAWVHTVEIHSEKSAANRPYESARELDEPRARIVYVDDGSVDPGWYVQYQDERKLNRQALWQSDPNDVEAALTEAAWLMGCHPDEIAIGGEILDWPGDASGH